MDEIIFRLRSAENPFYIDAVIIYNKTLIQRGTNKSWLSKCLDLLRERQPKTTKFSYRICPSSACFSHASLFRRDIDLQLSYGKNFHYFCFSHHLMDGYSFMLFCKEFYTLLGMYKQNAEDLSQLEQPRRINDKVDFHLSKKFPCAGDLQTLCTSVVNCVNFFTRPILSLFGGQVSPSKELGGFLSAQSDSFSFFSVEKWSPKNICGKSQTFNQTTCSFIADACKKSLDIFRGKDKTNISFGIPVYVNETGKSGLFGNNMMVVYDDPLLTNSKNYILLAVLCVLIKMASFLPLPSYLINFIFECGLEQIDIVYSNIDARRLSDQDALVNVAYMCPTFHKTLLSVCVITFRDRVNVACRSLRLEQTQMDKLSITLQSLLQRN
jgi:hypothetical protein